MPIRKFHSIEDMKAKDEWYQSGSPEHLDALQALWELYLKTQKPKQKPGIRKFKNIEELKKNKEYPD